MSVDVHRKLDVSSGSLYGYIRQKRSVKGHKSPAVGVYKIVDITANDCSNFALALLIVRRIKSCLLQEDQEVARKTEEANRGRRGGRALVDFGTPHAKPIDESIDLSEDDKLLDHTIWRSRVVLNSFR